MAVIMLPTVGYSDAAIKTTIAVGSAFDWGCYDRAHAANWLGA